MDLRVYEREKLYKEIWAEPMIKVAERYNVSDVALKKTCKKLNIPVPGRGYWSKVYAGANITIPPLPKQEEPNVVFMQKNPRSQIGNTNVMKNADSLLFLSDDKREEVKTFCASLTVPIELKQPHVLIQETIQYHKSRKETTKPPVNRVLNFNTSDEQRNRAYRIWDTLFKALEKLGYTVKIDTPKAKQYWNYEPGVSSNVTYIKLGQDMVPVNIKELTQRIPHTPTEKEIAEKKRYIYTSIPEYDYVYSGKLSLIIDEYIAKRKSWNDGKIQRIENTIGEIVISIIETINAVKERREEREIAEVKRREEEIRRWELKKKHDREMEKLDSLILKANDYHQAQNLYEYILALENTLPTVKEDKKTEFMKYLLWAKQKADWINPLVGREDELLGKRHKYTIEDVILEEDKDK